MAYMGYIRGILLNTRGIYYLIHGVYTTIYTGYILLYTRGIYYYIHGVYTTTIYTGYILLYTRGIYYYIHGVYTLNCCMTLFHDQEMLVNVA